MCDSDRCYGYMGEDPHGKYVEYTDYITAIDNIIATADYAKAPDPKRSKNVRK